jgi:hypothetical protein
MFAGQIHPLHRVFTTSAKPTTKKKVIYAEFPACGVIEEEMPIKKSATPGQQRTLWELMAA